MARTLDDVLNGPTPLPPTATLATPEMWAANTQPYPDSWEAVQRAMPQMPPMATPPMPQTPTLSPLATLGQAAAAHYQHNPAAIRAQVQLGMTSGLLDPRTAGATFSHQQLAAAGRRFGEQFGEIASYVGMLGGAPGEALGTAASLGGGWVGEHIATNPLFTGIHEAIYGGAAQDLSTMAQLQHGTFGQLQLTGNQAGLGGMGMAAPAALSLGHRFNRMSEQFAKRNPELAEKLGGGDIDVGKQRYSQDLVNLTRMAGDTGLLDAAANVDQIGDTVSKLVKVLGTMGKITGDPDFRNNLRELANVRQLGYTMDQALDATKRMERFAGQLGISRMELVSGAGATGAAAFKAAGLSRGSGMLFGAGAAVTAKQLGGTFSPLQEELLGGREGIQQRLVQGQARFLSGPAMRMMLGATMGAGAGGGVELDATKLQRVLSGGMSVTGLAAASQGNLMDMATKMAKQQHRSVADVMVEIQQRMPEFQSMIALQMGPERMQDLQLQTMGALSKRMGLRGAAQIVGGSAQQANLLIGAATDPRVYERRMVSLREEMKDAEDAARADADRRRKKREELRDRYTAGYLGYRSVGRGIEATARAITSWPEVSGYIDRLNSQAAEERALRIAQSEDAARGIKSARLSRTMQPNQKILDEMLTQSRQKGLTLDYSGMDQFQRAQANLGRGGRMTMSQLSVAQEAMGGYEEGVVAGTGRLWERLELGLGSEVEDAARFSRDIYGVGSGRLGTAAQRRRDAIMAKANAAMRRTYEAAHAIDRTRTVTSRQYSKQLQEQAVELTKAGLPAVSTLVTMQKNILSYADRIGRGEGGKVLNPEGILEEYAKGLASSGNMSIGRARRIVQKNREYYLKSAMSAIRTEGTAPAKAALTETTDVALRHLNEAMDPKQMQEELTQAQDAMEERLSKLGITEGGWWSGYALSDEEKTAISGLKDIETPEEQALVAVLAGAESGDEETKEAAKLELMKARTDPAKAEQLEKARTALEKIRKKGGGKAVQTLANIANLEMKNADTLSGMSKTMKAMRKGKGILDVLTKPEQILTRAKEHGLDITGGKISAPGTPESDQTRDVQDRMDMVKQLKEQFTGPHGAAANLNVAAKNLIGAARVLRGSKVDDRAEHIRNQVKE